MNAMKNTWDILQNEDDMKELAEMALRMTVKEMAAELKVSAGKVYILLRHGGLKARVSERISCVKRRKKSDMFDLDFCKSHSAEEVASEYGCTVDYARRYLRSNGLYGGKGKDSDIIAWVTRETRNKVRYCYYNMLKRCYDSQDRHFDRYGGRGIKVCEEWKNDCRSFYKWARENGYVLGLQLDRKDNDGEYSPENCRWVTARENSYNKCCTRKIKCFGKVQTLLDWEKETGIPRNVLADRIFKYKWDVERALTEEPMR